MMWVWCGYGAVWCEFGLSMRVWCGYGLGMRVVVGAVAGAVRGAGVCGCGCSGPKCFQK